MASVKDTGEDSSMANEQQLALLKQGVEVWNQWRQQYPEVEPDLKGIELSLEDLGGINLAGADLRCCQLAGVNLMGASLRQADLGGANLSGAYMSNADLFEANLSEANLSEAYLFEANLSRVNLNRADLYRVYLGKADLSGADLIGANLSGVDLRGADLVGANLSEADLRQANLIGADLQWADLQHSDLAGANLMGARLLKTNFKQANLSGCLIYGTSCWGLNLEDANQSDLVITLPEEPTIAVDNFEVAQFIYQLLNYKTVHDVINTVPAKVVLIMGCFTSIERKAVLDVIRDELRQQGYLPVAFELEKPPTQDLTEAISTLARIARFIIADLTDTKDILQELHRSVSSLPSVPMQLLLQSSAEQEYSLLEYFQQYSGMLETYRYDALEEVIASLEEKVIAPAEAKAKKLYYARTQADNWVANR